ncbi:hypothetical protein DPMN_012029 [Dreissena polymorpha]|uniref:Uncharacterized protein n=1 Tax=Dreissena polymorpha TaxID=45954 RepID=A0A9D4N535_DREPO|nr:hypothetical protein DPMN_012029 [Dreissena polymorpha]
MRKQPALLFAIGKQPVGGFNLGQNNHSEHPFTSHCRTPLLQGVSLLFCQCIWKIPIDEIDRSGSFPAHLNRCIELLLHILREEHDSRTLHEVHLQLNRQPEPGRWVHPGILFQRL